MAARPARLPIKQTMRAAQVEAVQVVLMARVVPAAHVKTASVAVPTVEVALTVAVLDQSGPAAKVSPVATIDSASGAVPKQLRTHSAIPAAPAVAAAAAPQTHQ